MIVNIMTNFGCNYRCDYCYLGSLRNDPRFLNPEDLRSKLEEINYRYPIDTAINIFGGEVTLLPIDVLEWYVHYAGYFCGNVSLFTNLSNVEKINDLYEKNNGFDISVSINPDRPNIDTTLRNIPFLGPKLSSVNVVATPMVMKMNYNDTLLEWIEENVKANNRYTVNFMQYFPSVENNKYKISNMDYAQFCISLILTYSGENYYDLNSDHKYSFDINLIKDLMDCYNKKYDPTLKSHIFITPNNKYAIVRFDNDGVEHFEEFDTLDQYEKFIKKEDKTYRHRCRHCPYFRHCYAEHLRQTSKGDDCSGLKYLMKWFYETFLL